MNKLLLGILGTVGVGALGAAAVLYSGVIDVAADTPHSPLVQRLIETARERAIARRIQDLTVPPDLDDAERVRRGAGNYAAMCVDCHLSPGVDDTEIRRGLYPQPPDLASPGAARENPARRFWIIRHGIKASGMPAWSKGGMGDDNLWDLVAFLGRLPTLSPEQYRAQVAASDGHSHAGPAAGKRAPAEADAHDHSSHPH